MKIAIYDVEVFDYDWIVVFKDRETGTYTVIHNDNEALRECMNDETIYCGFNSKHYDQYIIKAIAADFSPEKIKQVNNYIIGGGQGWECPTLKNIYYSFNNIDIKDDMQMGLSLKAIEGHLGMSVQETTVSFDIDRPLTESEIEETVFYCKHDVDTTDKLFSLRKNYLKNKVNIGRLAGITDVKAMGMTNAKLTAALLKAYRREYNDEREYQYPDNLLREYIPPEVFAFFDKMKDETLTDKEVFSDKLEIYIGECPVTIGYGGIHGALPHFIWNESEDGFIIVNDDVGSYYPHLMTLYGYTSRNIPQAEIFSNVLDTRMKAKANGDTETANALKLVVNTTYGASLNKYNDLYDPLMGRSVCITGQLFLLELAEHLFSEIPSLKIVQLNTDGIMVMLHRDNYEQAKAIFEEWQKRTGFDLEEDNIKQIAQKDVNNYIEVQTNGDIKSKGGYLVRGVAPAGAFNINNNACIVATAIQNYFLKGTPVEETINGCNDIFQFQLIAKAGAKYREAYHLVDKIQEPVQRVNRVYATADKRYGKLFKVKTEDDSTAKIESLPEHCIIDNDNRLSIDDIDKTFYIELAKKRINDFKGIKPEKKPKGGKRMATKKTAATAAPETPTTPTAPDIKYSDMNVYQKLLAARVKFLELGIGKSGKHMELRYKYFELEDIVPSATKIFNEVGLIALTSFSEGTARMTIVNVDEPDDIINFTSPMRYPSENRMINPVQALGSAETYLRRYLYMNALDITEPDSIEPTTVNDDAPAPKKPATPEQREEVKKELTAPKDNATELQIKGLKKVLKQLKEAQPDKEEMIAKIAVQTKAFTEISKSDCEELIERITAMMNTEDEE